MNESTEGPLVSLEGVTKEYRFGGSVIKALDGATWHLDGGSRLIAILGPSGSGKTTLLNLVGALDLPTHGGVTVAGQRVDRMSEPERVEHRRHRVGFVFQTFNLIPNLSALENVMLPMEFLRVRRSQAMERAQRLLEEVGLGQRLKHQPGRLSGGEQQRVAIARALANDPPLILADEPTGNLDWETGGEIIGMLKALAHDHQKTVIVVTHDVDLVEMAGQAFRLRDGKISPFEPSR